jgi:hypothetical protein
VNAYRCFSICLIFLLPLQLVAVSQDVWFWAPPKPIGDGSDYEAIGYELSQGQGWSTNFSNESWRDFYKTYDPIGYKQTLDRRSPLVADTNRPPLFPTWTAVIYRLVPRGPYSSAAIRLSLAAAIAIGCSIAAAWGWCLASTSSSAWLRQHAFWLAWFAMIVVFTERNLRNYATDFLTEPFALMGFSAFAILIWCAVHRSSITFAIWSGIAFGFLIHCRSAFVLWIPFLPACLWLSMVKTEIPNRTKWKLILTFFISLLLIVAPWWIRNIMVLGELQPLGTKGPTTLLGGYCDESLNAGGEWQFGPEKRLREEVYGRLDLGSATSQEWIETEKTIASEASQRVVHWIRTNFASLPQLMVQRVVTEWNPYTGKSLLFKILALVGVTALWLQDRRILLWLTVPLLVNSVVVAGTYSLGGRFLVPTYGCFYLLVSTGFLYMFSEFARVLGSRNMRGTSKMDRDASKS